MIRTFLVALCLLGTVIGGSPDIVSAGQEKSSPNDERGAAAGVVPRTVPQGGVVLVRVATRDAGVGPELTLGGRTVPMVQEGDGWLGIVGVDLATAPGRHRIVMNDGAHDVRAWEIDVTAPDFPEEQLTLPKRMVTPAPEDLRRIREESQRLSELWPRSNPRLWGPGFSMPVDSAVITPFGVRRILNGIPKSSHKGLDLRGKEGTPVGAINAGRVVLVEDQYYGGLTVVVDHGAGIYSYYMHLSAASVAAGDLVSRGAPIGAIGKSGRATGPHLHFGVKIAGANVDPGALVNLPLRGGE